MGVSNTKPKPLDLSMLLRDAFLAGRGRKDGDKLSEEDQAAWMAYDPTRMNAFNRITGALDAASKPVSAAVALVDKHISAAVRCKDEPIYKNGVPMAILIQDLRELRESIGALGDKLGPWLPEPPTGWFLYGAAHQHTSIVFNGDKHEPLPHGNGPWLVQFQRLPHGGLLTEGRGRSFAEAWENACIAVSLRAAA